MATNLVPAFPAPPTSLGSSRASEHDRLTTLLQLARPAQGGLKNFEHCLPPIRPDDHDEGIPSSGVRFSERLDELSDRPSKKSRAQAPASLDLFEGQLTWSKPTKLVNAVEPHQPKSQPKAMRAVHAPQQFKPPPVGQPEISKFLDPAPMPPPPPPAPIPAAVSLEKQAQTSQPVAPARQTALPVKPAAASKSLADVLRRADATVAEHQKKMKKPADGQHIASQPVKVLRPGPLTPFTGDDFAGIERTCRNAGATPAGLEAFSTHVASMNILSLSILFRDLTSSHSSSSVRYCTPSARCAVWHCSCDKIIRASAAGNILGAVVVGDDVVYFLPLVKCVEPSDEDSKLLDRGQPAEPFPLKCSTTHVQRWTALISLMRSASIKVMYNLQVACLPLHAACHALGCFDHHPAAFDPRLAAYLLDPDTEDEQLELFALLGAMGGVDVSGLGRLGRVIAKVSAELKALLALHSKLSQELDTTGLKPLFDRVEMPLAFILSSMEEQGIAVDKLAFESNAQQIRQQLQQTEHSIYEAAHMKFNIASPEQVAKVLEDLRIRPAAADEQAQPQGQAAAADGKKFQSTSEDELLKLRHLHPVVDMILQHRTLSKLMGTYIEGLRPLLVPKDAASYLVHANWNQTSVRTGRLSCSKPNLQNIPNSQTIGGVEYNMRSMFIAREGYTFVGADYSQVEMRVLTHLTQDPALCNLFRREGDIYSLLAARIFSKPIEQVQSDERDKAKVITLGVLYGMGVPATAAKLNMDNQSAARIVQAFFTHFGHVKGWINKVKAHAKQHLQVRTLLGRVRHLPNMHSADKVKSSAAERQAVNSIIQGTASDLIKLAMVVSFRHLAAENSLQFKQQSAMDASSHPTRLVMQIHDELIFEVRDEAAHLEAFTAKLRDIMENEVVSMLKLQVPLIANISVGKRWGEMRPLQQWQEGGGAEEG